MIVALYSARLNTHRNGILKRCLVVIWLFCLLLSLFGFSCCCLGLVVVVGGGGGGSMSPLLPGLEPATFQSLTNESIDQPLSRCERRYTLTSKVVTLVHPNGFFENKLECVRYTVRKTLRPV